MRISERKRRLRESADAPIHSVSTSRGAAEPRPKQSSARNRAGTAQASSAKDRPVRRAQPRGPRFYAGFGIVGLVFSAILAESTYASYNDKVNTYHKAVAAYPQQLASYKVALARYTAAHGVHMVKPHMPAVPVEPTPLNILAFLLPILYGALSVAYWYLAYRTVKSRAIVPGTISKA